MLDENAEASMQHKKSQVHPLSDYIPLAIICQIHDLFPVCIHSSCHPYI